MYTISNNKVKINILGEEDIFWDYTIISTGESFKFASPAFEIDGERQALMLQNMKETKKAKLNNGCTEYEISGELIHKTNINVSLVFRIAEDNPIVRFYYELKGKSGSRHRLTRSSGKDQIDYLTTSLKDLPQTKEIRVSEFIEKVHSFCLTETEIPNYQFDYEQKLMGPIIVGANKEYNLLLAYEHGSQVPDAFLQYWLKGERIVQLKAVKGNYYHNQPINENGYRTVWFQVGAVHGCEDQLAKAYREFVLKYMSSNLESREPYIFYNTWNYQERNRHWYGKRYLDEMNLERMLKEIDVAYEMGIEVFVIDTGWYQKTGDWQVSLERFPDGLKQVKEKLDSYGMKLGLWFDPKSAAVTSRMVKKNEQNVMSWNGEKGKPRPIWETEESLPMCLVSSYSDDFADELIRLVRDLGVTYFKWDAIGQYGCNDPNHNHGTEENSPQERADYYAFKQGIEMARIVDKLCAKCPEAIVDFDVTEGHRFVGLSFLSAGKYFLINNGPYFHNYNVPIDMEKDNWNLFFFPGPARGWICRTPLNYDKWIPSVLFLTHYLPDDPVKNQLLSIGSLILGQNGIWGDLLSISKEGISTFHRILKRYKEIRDDITNSSPIRTGVVGGSPEIHEKIDEESGKGAVVLFANEEGCYTYITHHQTDVNYWHTEGVKVYRGPDGRAKIEVQMDKPSAAIILFGVV